MVKFHATPKSHCYTTLWRIACVRRCGLMSNYFDQLLDLATPVEKIGFNVLFCTKSAVVTSKNCALLGKNLR